MGQVYGMRSPFYVIELELIACDQEPTLPHVLLLTKQPKLPVLWKVLGWRHHKQVSFGATKDEKGEIIKELGIDAPADGKSKVLVWAPGETKPTLYDGK